MATKLPIVWQTLVRNFVSLFPLFGLGYSAATCFRTAPRRRGSVLQNRMAESLFLRTGRQEQDDQLRRFNRLHNSSSRPQSICPQRSIRGGPSVLFLKPSATNFRESRSRHGFSSLRSFTVRDRSLMLLLLRHVVPWASLRGETAPVVFSFW